MECRKVDDDFYVAAQMHPHDLAGLAEQGFTTIICNRPDAEEPGQPPLDDMRRAAQDAGLAFHHVPVAGGEFPPAAVAAFAAIHRASSGQVLAYCRSGMRAIALDALANIKGVTVESRLANAQAAGYDLSGLAGQMAAGT